MKASEVTGMSLGQVVENFVDENLMENVGTMLSARKISVGTVHFTLGMMIADDISSNADTIEEALAVLTTFHHFMYQIVSQTMMNKIKKQREN